MKQFLIFILFIHICAPVWGQQSFADNPEQIEQEAELEQSSESVKTDESRSEDKVDSVLNYFKSFGESGESGEGAADSQSFLSAALERVKNEFVQKMLKENPFSQMERTKVRQILIDSTKESRWGKRFEEDPRFLETATDFLHDKEALPKLFSVLNQPKKMEIYFYISVGLFILSFILNMLNSKGSFWKKLGRKLLITILLLAVNLGTFGVLFQKEVGPTFRIVTNRFL